MKTEKERERQFLMDNVTNLFKRKRINQQSMVTLNMEK